MQSSRLLAAALGGPLPPSSGTSGHSISRLSEANRFESLGSDADDHVAANRAGAKQAEEFRQSQAVLDDSEHVDRVQHADTMESPISGGLPSSSLTQQQGGGGGGREKTPLLSVGDRLQAKPGVEVLVVGSRLNWRGDWIFKLAIRVRREAVIFLDLTKLTLVVEKSRYWRRTKKTREIRLFDVEDVRPGHASMNFQRWGRSTNKDLSFCVVYRWSKARARLLRTENFVLSGTKQDRDNVVEMLQDVVAAVKEGRLQPSDNNNNNNNGSVMFMSGATASNVALWSRRALKGTNSRTAFWVNTLRAHDRNGDNAWDEAELASILRYLGTATPGQSQSQQPIMILPTLLAYDAPEITAARELIKRYDENGDGKLQPSEFARVLWAWKTRPYLAPVFADACGSEVRVEDVGNPDSGVTMDVEHLRNFLTSVQGEDMNEADTLVDMVMRKFGVALQKEHEQLALDFAGFCDFITSANSNSGIEKTRDGNRNMSHPLSHYFCSSSHNTYLRADQLVGSAGVVGYINAFTLGNRCVEVDLWDGLTGHPIVTHGHTATESMPFSGFVDVMLSRALLSSPSSQSWPVIVSLENHASLAQQRVAAELMMKEFGARVLSFEEMKALIIGGEEDGTNGEDDINGGNLPSPEQLRGRVLIKASLDQVTEPTLASLVSLRIEPFLGDTNEAWDIMCSRPAYSMLNIPETVMGSISLTSRAREFSRKHLIRVYPFGFRIDSSNLDPLLSWERGAQIAALNVQKPGVRMRVNQSLFDRTYGYSAVPWDDLEMERSVVDAASSLSAISPLSSTASSVGMLRIRILGGFMFPKPGAGHSVRVQVHVYDFGVMDPEFGGQEAEDDNQDATQTRDIVLRTRKVRDNGFDPDFGGDAGTIVTKSPRTAIVIFNVVSESRVRAYAGCPFLDLRQGYRALALTDNSLHRPLVGDGVVILHVSRV